MAICKIHIYLGLFHMQNIMMLINMHNMQNNKLNLQNNMQENMTIWQYGKIEKCEIYTPLSHMQNTT
jgi:hypothetical protein